MSCRYEKQHRSWRSSSRAILPASMAVGFGSRVTVKSRKQRKEGRKINLQWCNNDADWSCNAINRVCPGQGMIEWSCLPEASVRRGADVCTEVASLTLSCAMSR
jgi:hypothetical protein